ncbi:MAG: HAD-IB family phosphatase [Anaerolineae bacterium]|jgi:phosphoserine phosphatase|nr:HAD-IB family phosphatase [Anaerolineae bacterium]
MTEARWAGYDLVFFDCDSTLSTIEGIDELARLKGKEQRVSVLTNKAMNGDLDLAEVYGKRLKAIRPTRGQLKEVEAMYYATMVEDAREVVAALHFMGRQVFIISGGLIDAVRGFGRRLGIAGDNIRAVALEYNELSGEWWRSDNPGAQHQQTYLEYVEGPLTISSGKPEIIQELAGERPGRRFMVGDGTSDLATRPVVDLFVGYGGVIARDKVRDGSDIFIATPSLAPVLPLAGGSAGYARVRGTPHQAVFDKGIRLALAGGVLFADAARRQLFATAFTTWDEEPLER